MKMDFVFEVIDKTERKIHLSKKQWSHILRKHPQVANYQEEIMSTLKHPLKITDYSLDEDVGYYYKYLKDMNIFKKYLVIVVKYLNGTGFVISAFFEKHIK